MDKKEKSFSGELIFSEEDVRWDIVPLGVCFNEKGEQVKVGWNLIDCTNEIGYYPIKQMPSILISGGTGSGKSILKEGIITHLSKYPDKFQLVGCDIQKVEFYTYMRDKFVDVLFDTNSTALFLQKLKQIMFDRYELIDMHQVNNIHKIGLNDIVESDYYEIPYDNNLSLKKSCQYDTLFRVCINPEETNIVDRQYDILSIEEIYNILQVEEGSVNVYINGQYYNLTKNDIKKTSDIYHPTDIVFVVNELIEIMSTHDANYKTIKDSLETIARLGRVSGIHLVLVSQKPIKSVFTPDMQSNITAIWMRNYDEDILNYLLDSKDISIINNPGIGVLQTNNGNIIQFQSYYWE